MKDTELIKQHCLNIKSLLEIIPIRSDFTKGQLAMCESIIFLCDNLTDSPGTTPGEPAAAESPINREFFSMLKP